MMLLLLLLILQSISLFAQIKTKKVEIFSSTAGEILNAQITIEPEKENITEIPIYNCGNEIVKNSVSDKFD